MEILVKTRNLSGLEGFVNENSLVNGVKDASLFESLQGKVDRSMREEAMEIVVTSTDDVLLPTVRQHIAFSVKTYAKGLCSKTIPIVCMSDMLDISGIGKCERLFAVIEENQLEFKKLEIHSVLRLCNDLLKRLSRYSENSFCGRILCFLSRLLSLTEKSGVNQSGQFNTFNITNYEHEPSEISESELIAPTAEPDDMETGEIRENKDSTIPVDHALYLKFWQMQDFFCNPNDCYDKIKWPLFRTNASEVLNVFASYKLEKGNEEEEKNRKRKLPDHELTLENMDDSDTYFAKHLTSPKLLQLQFNDSQFRRSFLLQCLILFQYLTSECKFKPKQHLLSEDMLRFVVESQDKCYKLLKETHPRGSHFTDSVKKILGREEHWSEWKNQGCQDFTKLADTTVMKPYRKLPRITFKPDEVDLGNTELTKLWRFEPNLLDACKSKARDFTPKLSEFLVDPLDEMDPEQQVEEQYKSIYNSGFQWRASRLFLLEAPAFLTANASMATPKNKALAVPKLLEHTIMKTAQQIPSLKKILDNREAAARKKVEESMIRARERSSEGSPAPDMLLSVSKIDAVAKLLTDQWKELAEAIGLNKEQIAKLGKEQTSAEATKTLISQWAEENNNSSRELLKFLLMCDLMNEHINSVIKSKE